MIRAELRPGEYQRSPQSEGTQMLEVPVGGTPRAPIRVRFHLIPDPPQPAEHPGVMPHIRETSTEFDFSDRYFGHLTIQTVSPALALARLQADASAHPADQRLREIAQAAENLNAAITNTQAGSGQGPSPTNAPQPSARQPPSLPTYPAVGQGQSPERRPDPQRRRPT